MKQYYTKAQLEQIVIQQLKTISQITEFIELIKEQNQLIVEAKEKFSYEVEGIGLRRVVYPTVKEHEILLDREEKTENKDV